ATMRTMQDLYDQSMTRTSFTMVMLGIAGAMALALGIIGIYGVVSYLVSQRTHEIGIRMALGAQPRDVRGMILKEGGALTLAGIFVGVAAALGLTRFMATLLYGVKPWDPMAFGGVVILLGAVAVFAAYVPARRAMRVDPMVALRHE
ncbi:MAG: FtsX-like permease family protein, partial [Acidobacteriota bacterium]|nr:FtsX-like permease family protein [Acidobacteriota bacterium]